MKNHIKQMLNDVISRVVDPSNLHENVYEFVDEKFNVTYSAQRRELDDKYTNIVAKIYDFNNSDYADILLGLEDFYVVSNQVLMMPLWLSVHILKDEMQNDCFFMKHNTNFYKYDNCIIHAATNTNLQTYEQHIIPKKEQCERNCVVFDTDLKVIPNHHL